MSAEDGRFAGRWKPALTAKSLARRALDVVFPPRALDGGPAALAGGLSAETWSRIRFIVGPVCDGCGAHFEFDLGAGARCAACMARPRAFAAARAASLYDEASREFVEGADAVVPAPLHPLRLLKRRYNQAAEIARPLARREALVYLPDALVRRRRTETQAGKSGSGRRRNVAAAFEAPAARRRLAAGRRFLLIDDVMTTGPTPRAARGS